MTAPVDPVLYVDWSLNFEMMFYAIFAVALFFRGDRRLIVAGTSIIALWVCHFIFGNPYLQWAGSPVIFGFVAGIYVWKAPLIPANASFVFLPLSIALLASPDILGMAPSNSVHFWTAGDALLVFL